MVGARRLKTSPERQDKIPAAAELKRAQNRLAAETAERRRLEAALRLLPHQILTAQDTERRRIAAELHDGVIQLLGSIKFRLAHLEEKLGKHSAAGSVGQTRELLERAVTEVRRISNNLRPPELDDFGLIPAIQGLLRDFETRSRIALQFKSGQLRRLPRDLELAIYRILQEAIANIEEHSGARQVFISLLADAHFVTLNIRDDGRGFKSDKAGPDKRGRGLGLINMRERSVAHGGVFAIQSAPGRGTEISVHLKLASS